MPVQLKFTVDKVTFNVSWNDRGGAVSSDIDEVLGITSFHTDDGYQAGDVYGAYKDALYSFILGYFRNRGELTCAFYCGVRSILNSMQQYDFT